MDFTESEIKMKPVRMNEDTFGRATIVDQESPLLIENFDVVYRTQPMPTMALGRRTTEVNDLESEAASLRVSK